MSLQLKEAANFLEDILSFAHPQLDFRRTRVLHETLVTPAAHITSKHSEMLDDLERGMFISNALDDPDALSEEQLDNLLSNYFLERYAGEVASGSVRIILPSPGTFVIPVGSTFSFGSVQYAIPRPVVAARVPQTANGVPIVAYGDRYAVSVPVVAVEVGSLYNIANGTELTWDAPAVPYETAAAEGDFMGGADEESNESLVSRIQAARAAKAFSARPNIQAWLQERDPSVHSAEVLGTGDPELLRGIHPFFGFRVSDAVDVYIKKRLQEVTVRLKGTVLNRTMKQTRLVIPRDAFPGFYMISRIVPAGLTVSPVITESIQSSSTSDLTTNVGDLTAQEAAFTRYQFMSLTMTDRAVDLSDASDGDEIEYEVSLLGLAGIAPLQDLIQSRSMGPVMGSYLVKAAIPVFTTVDFGITNPDNFPVEYLDLPGMRAAVADAITNLPIGTKTIRSSLVSAAVADFLPKGSEVIEPLHMTARIVLPDLQTITVAGTHGITIPDDLPYGITHRICGMYTTTKTVGITVES